MQKMGDDCLRGNEHFRSIYLTSWAWLLLLARVAERGLGEEGNESGDGSGDSETFLSSSAQLWGNQRDEGGDSGSTGSLGCDFHLKSFQLEGCQKQENKNGAPWLPLQLLGLSPHYIPRQPSR